MAHCKCCNREVGIESKRPWVPVVILGILGLIVPLWIITLPLFWGLALLLLLTKSKRVCGICKTPLT